jgi:hypothetical protein
MKFLGLIIANVLIIGITYLLFAFIETELNSFLWHWWTRAIFSLSALGGLIGSINNIYGKGK